MLFYRLVICRLSKVLGWDEYLEEKERRAIMLGKKKKTIYHSKLRMDETMITRIFLLMVFTNCLFMLTLPIAALNEPCEAFKENKMPKLYAFVVTVKKYSMLIDRIAVVLTGVAVVMTVKTVLDGVAVTKIPKSPWLEQGKYDLPGPGEFCDHKIKDPAKEHAKARARARYIEDLIDYNYKRYHREHNW